MSGRYKMEVREAGTDKLTKVREFDNLITNGGLDSYSGRSRKLSDNSYHSNNTYACVVGTGTNAPTIHDSQLGHQIARTESISGISSTKPKAPDYVSSYTAKYRFNVGAATGNLTEVGIASRYGSDEAYPLFSRALILDNGVPSSLTVLENEYLDVYYTIFFHPDLGDVEFTFNIGEETYEGTARFCGLGDSYVTFGNAFSIPHGVDIRTVYNDKMELVDIDKYPEAKWIPGLKSAPTNNSYPALHAEYIPGSYYVLWRKSLRLAEANVEGGFKGCLIQHTAFGNYGFTDNCMNASSQVVFNKCIPKDDTNELNLVAKVSWHRYVEP